jgi:hypothetical protein
MLDASDGRASGRVHPDLRAKAFQDHASLVVQGESVPDKSAGREPAYSVVPASEDEARVGRVRLLVEPVVAGAGVRRDRDAAAQRDARRVGPRDSDVQAVERCSERRGRRSVECAVAEAAAARASKVFAAERRAASLLLEAASMARMDSANRALVQRERFVPAASHASSREAAGLRRQASELVDP